MMRCSAGCCLCAELCDVAVSSIMKLSSPCRMELTDHSGFHVSG